MKTGRVLIIKKENRYKKGGKLKKLLDSTENFLHHTIDVQHILNMNL